MRGRLCRVALVALVGAVGIATPPPPALGKGKSTLKRTIRGPAPEGGFSALGYRPGEPYRVRDALIDGDLHPRRRARRTSIIYFGQISDLQLADEESPARVEYFDGEPGSRFSNAGFRPNEAINPFSIDAAVRSINSFYRSRLRDRFGHRARMRNVMLTGDLADNMHQNEVGWMRTLIEGGRIDPNSGTNAGVGAGCELPVPRDNPRNYTGVQDYDDYPTPNTLYYDPDEPIGQWSSWPTYPGLLDRAQRPFRAAGLRAPSYVVLGNHDVLFQGTIAAQPGFEKVGLGCFKYSAAVPGMSQDTLGAYLDPTTLAALAPTNPGAIMLVPDDPARRFVDRAQYKSILASGDQADDHGFAYVNAGEEAASNAHAAYYSFKPRPGVRFIVLDTNAEAGVVYSGTSDGSQGNLDDPQWRWLEKELRKATRRNEIAIAFAHHPLRTMTNALADEDSTCDSDDGHGHPTTPSCDSDPRTSTPLHNGEDLADLFSSYPHLVAFVAGHAHRNKVTLYEGRAPGERGFWQIETPAIADWPVQTRLIQLFNNHDRTLSIFGTLIDTAAPAAIAPNGTRGDALGRRALAAIHRSMAFNDPQNGSGDPDAARGLRRDRNVELLIDDPRR